jgi:hypothetical protein
MNIKPRDEVRVEFSLRIDEVTYCKDPKKSKVYGFTQDGVYAVVPLSAVKEVLNTGTHYAYAGD